MTIWFDMDGTLNRFYDREDWLECLRAYDVTPYAEAAVMFNMSKLARYIHKVQAKGYKVGIISWLSKIPNDNYDEEVTQAKLNWLYTHLRSVVWDEIKIVRYGVPKSSFKHNDEDILFDDEQRNRDNWGKAYEPQEIFKVLKELINMDE